MMKTSITICIVALAFISFNAFSQTGSNGEQTPADLTAGSNTFTLSAGLNDNGGSKGAAEIYTSEEFSRDLIFCDDFNVPNTTNIIGWTEQSGDWQISGNMLQNAPTILYEWKYITVDGSAQADGCITGRAIYATPAVTKFVGLVGRYTNDNSRIMFKIQDNGSDGYWNTYWFYQNNSIIGSGSGNFGTDAIIRMEYSGTSLTGKIDVDRDGTWDYTYSANTTLTSSGLCGIGGYYNAFTDDYCCGAECGFPPVTEVPLSNMGLYIALALIMGFVVISIYRMK